MIRTIVQLDLDVHDIIAGDNAAEHGALDTLIDSGDVFLGDRTADNRVDELVVDVELSAAATCKVGW